MQNWLHTLLTANDVWWAINNLFGHSKREWKVPQCHLDVMLEQDRGGGSKLTPRPKFSVTSVWVILSQWGFKDPPGKSNIAYTPYQSLTGNNCRQWTLTDNNYCQWITRPSCQSSDYWVHGTVPTGSIPTGIVPTGTVPTSATPGHYRLWVKKNKTPISCP